MPDPESGIPVLEAVLWFVLGAVMAAFVVYVTAPVWL